MLRACFRRGFRLDRKHCNVGHVLFRSRDVDYDSVHPFMLLLLLLREGPERRLRDLRSAAGSIEAELIVENFMR